MRRLLVVNQNLIKNLLFIVAIIAILSVGISLKLSSNSAKEHTEKAR